MKKRWGGGVILNRSDDWGFSPIALGDIVDEQEERRLQLLLAQGKNNTFQNAAAKQVTMDPGAVVRLQNFLSTDWEKTNRDTALEKIAFVSIKCAAIFGIAGLVIGLYTFQPLYLYGIKCVIKGSIVPGLAAAVTGGILSGLGLLVSDD